MLIRATIPDEGLTIAADGASYAPDADGWLDVPAALGEHLLSFGGFTTDPTPDRESVVTPEKSSEETAATAVPAKKAPAKRAPRKA